MINDFLKGQEEVEKVKEHLTRAHGSYNMLTEMIENLMSEE
jgi:predicted small metal-binding protein